MLIAFNRFTPIIVGRQETPASELSMGATTTSVVTFKSSAFNTSEPREYFINPVCFGDDVARWLAAELRGRRHPVDETPSQEDFGWYLRFSVSDIEHCLVIGHRPGSDGQEGVWIGWLERDRGPISSLFGGRKRAIQLRAAQAIHEILASSSQIRNVRWHQKFAYDTNDEAGLLEPSPS